ncbi:MAG: stage 0 sporulation family protein [Acidobacteria bacterium]|nr:stage 0 sporulation family protein [Acidobacteriota bacterium]
MDPRPPGAFVSIKLTPVGRVQYFLLDDLASGPTPPAPGDQVVVDIDGGSAIGTVVPSVPALAARRLPALGSPRRVVRKATAQDVVTRLKQRHREEEALRIGAMKIRERGLAMKLTRVEHLLDGSKLVFYFTAEGRVDFRELVRELAGEFHIRIEMRQIGVRDEAKMLGGYGSCGRPLCCTTWLQSFEPISIKMAKQQDLSLNPSKLSGLCGRLKCCLRYELPNGKGLTHAGCAHEGGCDKSSGGCGGGCGSGGCGSGGGCGSCHR